jgi:hypothetical protein
MVDAMMSDTQTTADVSVRLTPGELAALALVLNQLADHLPMFASMVPADDAGMVPTLTAGVGKVVAAAARLTDGDQADTTIADALDAIVAADRTGIISYAIGSTLDRIRSERERFGFIDADDLAALQLAYRALGAI